MTRLDPRLAALEVVSQRFEGAAVTFLSGSVVRGEGTATSDLDMVVVYDNIEAAFRESFIHGDRPVEAFVHDPETLLYFFLQVDKPTGVPSLAEETIALGPTRWDEAATRASRYALTNLVDDLRDPRSRIELLGTASALYAAVAEHFLRAQGLWSAKDKSIPRRLEQVDREFAERFEAAFADLFSKAGTERLIELCEEVLRPHGGWLFAGYTTTAPKEWRGLEPRLGERWAELVEAPFMLVAIFYSHGLSFAGFQRLVERATLCLAERHCCF